MLQDSIGEVGKIKEFEREVDLNADKKRLWLDNLKTINHEKNESVPISLRFYEFLI
jgi:urease accessory protein UreH